jgi:enediyne biosynthesis protein E4
VSRKLVVALCAALPGIALAAPAPSPCGPVRLVDVAAEAGIAFRHLRGGTGARHLPETMGAGVAWLDFDGDGWWDLYLVQSGPFPPDGSAAAANRLFRNLGDGRFEDVTERAGVGDRGYGQGVLAADLDGSGLPDLYLPSFGPDVLLRNRGDGTFEDATAAAGLGDGGWGSSAAAADLTGSGHLDLYLTRYVEYDPAEELFCGDLEAGRRDYCDPTLFAGAADRLYRNRGDGTFEDVTARAGLGGADGKGLGVVLVDLDGDLAPEIYVANDLTSNLLFRNRGDGTFEDVSLLSGTAANREGAYEAGMGIAVGDVDGDGRPELAVTNFDVETNTLYRNLGELGFEDVSAASGFGLPSFNLLGFGIVFADLDGDGHLDVYAANGHIFETPRRENVAYAQRDLLLLGDGRGGFREVRCPELERSPQVGRGLAAADYDHDGDPDLAVQNSDGPALLLRNEGAGRSWLGVHLRGRGGNTEGVGARAALATCAGVQTRWVLAGDSYQSSSDKRLLFALPPGAEPLALEVVWPSGRRQRLPAPPLGRYLRLDEPPP